MRDTFFREREDPKMGKNMSYFGMFRLALYVLLVTIFIASCSKDSAKDQSVVDSSKVASISATFPANLADAVVVDPVVAVTFKNATDPLAISTSTLTLKNGNISVPGTVSYSGTTATFKPTTDLEPDTEYTATIKTSGKNSSSNDSSEHSWTFKTGRNHSDNESLVVSVVPLKRALSVPVTIQPSVTFNDKVKSSAIKSTTFTLTQGTTLIEGSVSYSDHSATFKPVNSLTANTVYTAKISSGNKNTSDDDKEDDHHDTSDHAAINYSWSFTTGEGGIDITAPTVNSAVPANNSTLVAVNIKPTVIFSEAMNPLSISSTTFTLLQGTTAVPGTVTYSGNTAIFTPASSLAANTIYSGTITTGAKDIAGNAIANNFTWSFTTSGSVVDVTAPTVLSETPANGTTTAAVSSHPAVTFSEVMNSATITSATFILNQGSTTVAGTVAYSGTTATFTPNSNLTGGLVYTATITTGVKDAAGNAITASKVWSFTTLAPVAAGLSFATDVVPVLNACNNCHMHGWTTSSVASSFYANLVSSGYVNSASYATSKLYTKVNGGHPGSSMPTADLNKLLDWLKQGSKNN